MLADNAASQQLDCYICSAANVLSLLPDLQGDLDLNICEAHAFTTTDKFSLDVFVVNGWQGEVR